MALYRVNHRYTSGTITLEEGSEVELEDGLAEWLERDSAGVITRTGASPEPERDPAAAAAADPEGADEDPVADEEPAAKPKRGRAKA